MKMTQPILSCKGGRQNFLQQKEVEMMLMDDNEDEGDDDQEDDEGGRQNCDTLSGGLDDVLQL